MWSLMSDVSPHLCVGNEQFYVAGEVDLWHNYISYPYFVYHCLQAFPDLM